MPVIGYRFRLPGAAQDRATRARTARARKTRWRSLWAALVLAIGVVIAQADASSITWRFYSGGFEYWNSYSIILPRNQAALDKLVSEGYKIVDRYDDPPYVRILHREIDDNGTKRPLTFLEAAANILDGYHEIDSMQPDYAVYTQLVPNDPANPAHWNLINAPTAWDITTGSTSETIAIVDGGGDSTHPDLIGRVVNYAPNSDAVDNDPDAAGSLEDVGHAARVAGVAAAVTNNAQDMAGIDWNAKILFVRALQADGTGSLLTVAKGIRTAVLNKASVINLSIGAVSDTMVNVIEDSLRQAHNAGIPVVAAAGNSETHTVNVTSFYIFGTNFMTYPATSRFAIAVGSSSSADARSASSAYTPPPSGHGVDLVAPGENVVTLTPGVGTDTTSGTSLSTAIVSGAVSLLRSLRPEYAPCNVYDLLIATVKDIGDVGYDVYTGYGRLDLVALLSAAKTATLFPFANDSAAIRSDSFSVDPVGDLRTATTSADGRQGRRRLVLTGNNIYAGYGNALAGDTGTIEFYFRYDSIQPADTAFILTQKGNGVKPKGSLDLILRTDSRLQFSLKDSGAIISRTRLNPNQWYHVAVSWGIRGMRLIVNDSAEAVQFVTGGPPAADTVYLGSPAAFGASSVRGSFDGLRFSSSQRLTFPSALNPRIESISTMARDMITVRWTTVKNETTSTYINVYADRDSVGFDGTLIASQLANDGYEGISASVLQSFNQKFYIYIEAVDGTYTNEISRIYYDTPATVFSSSTSFVTAVKPKSNQVCVLGAWTPDAMHMWLRGARDILLDNALARWVISLYYGIGS